MTMDPDGWRVADKSPFMELVGPILIRDTGKAREYGLRVARKHMNSLGTLHGGAIATLMDCALGMAVDHPGGKATMHLGINFLSAVREGDLLVVRCFVDRRGRQVAYVSATAEVEGRGAGTASAVLRLKRLDTGDRS